MPIRLSAIKALLCQLLPLGGIEWATPEGLVDPTSLEERVLEEFRDYWSYLRGNLVFDCRNTREALPDLPPPAFDRTLVSRLLSFAEEDNWGRGRSRPQRPDPFEIASYLEQVVPKRLQQSRVAQIVPLDLLFAFDIHGPGGGRWSCRRGREGWEVRRGPAGALVRYRTDAATFVSLVQRRQTAQEAFFDGRIDIEGDVETGLKLAAVIDRFLAEAPDGPSQPREVSCAAGER
jgi:hypothetical protein